MESAGERFGSGEAARFSYEQIGGGHVLVHFLCEAYRDKTRRRPFLHRGLLGGKLPRSGNGVELFLDVFGFAGDGDDLPRTIQGEQILARVVDRAVPYRLRRIE